MNADICEYLRDEKKKKNTREAQLLLSKKEESVKIETVKTEIVNETELTNPQ